MQTVVATETCLKGEVKPTYVRMCGIIHGARSDCRERTGGGETVSFKEGMQAQQLDTDSSPLMEVM